MICKQEGKKIFDDALKRFISQERNDKVMSLINGFSSLDIADDSGTTLLHLAAKWGNDGMVKFLMNSGCDLNIKNRLGWTPLLTSILYNRFDTVKLLLDANVDIDVTSVKGLSALSVALNVKRKVPIEIVRYFYDSLKRSGVDSEEIARKFLAAGCPLVSAVRMHDADMTRAILESKESIQERESSHAMRVAMKSGNLENVRVLLQYGPDVMERKVAFSDVLCLSIKFILPSVEFAKPFVDRLIDWDLVDTRFVRVLKEIFSYATKQAVEMFLERDIDVYVKEKFGIDLIFRLCGNARQGIVELLRSRKFDVNTRDSRGQTGLHLAAINCAIDNVRYLLDEGADPNAKDEFDGRTPLYVACERISQERMECLEILLQGGADVQAIDNYGCTVFNIPSNSNSLDIVLAHLAILEGQGTPIKQQIRDVVQSRRGLQPAYDSFCDRIGELKEHKIHRSFNLFDILTQTPVNIADNIRSRSVLSKNLDSFENGEWHWYYASTIKMHLSRALEIIDLRHTAAAIVQECVDNFVRMNCDHLALETIVGFLTYKDLRLFA